jgi:lysophospholipase L1-like esterase
VALVLLLPGAWLLGRPGRAARIAEALSHSLSSRGPRVALMLLGGLLAVIAWIFSVGAAIALVLLLGAAVMLQAIRRGPSGIQRLLAGTLLFGVTAIGAGLILEGVLGGLFAERIGAPSVRRVWQDRYADIGRRNLFGFRSPYENVAPQPGTLRVLALGDSYTWGDGIPRDHDTWPAQLERLLRDSLRTQVEVINTGRRGWTTANEAELLRRFGWQWTPDLVVLQFTLNDVRESSPGFRSVQEPMQRLLPHRFRTGSIGESALLFRLELQWTTFLNPNWRGVHAARYHPDSAAWQQTRAALQEIGSSGAARRIPVVLMIYPSFPPGPWTLASHPESRLIRLVDATGKEAGMDVLDLLPVFTAEGGNGRRWWVAPYDPHPTAEAHAIAVRALAARIFERRYLQAATGSRDSAAAHGSASGAR